MRTLLLCTLAAIAAPIAYGQVGSATAGQVSVSVFQNLSAPANSPPLRNIGQTNHVLVVARHDGRTTLASGIVCRIEASVNGTSWFPISVDVVYLPSLSPAAYAIVKANGVYPFIRVGCPTVPAAVPLDVNYLGSQYPYGDIGLVTDRYLTASVGSTVAALAGPTEPTGTDGIMPGISFSSEKTNSSTFHTSITDTGAQTYTYATTTSDNNTFNCGTILTCNSNINVWSTEIGTAWNKVTLKFGPWQYNDAYRNQCLVLRSHANLIVYAVECYTKDELSSGTYKITAAMWGIFSNNPQENTSATGTDPYMTGKTLFTSAGFGTAAKTSVILEATHAAGTVTFLYSLDNGATWTQAVQFADTAFDSGSRWSSNGSIAASWTGVGVSAMVGGMYNQANAANAADSFTIQRFKWY
jgi:hypothetical protein